MKKWLMFGGGVLTGIVLTIAFAVVYSTLSANCPGNDIYGATWFEKPTDVFEDIHGFKVFQVINADAALVVKNKTWSRDVFMLVNAEGKYYYDNEVVDVPTDMEVIQVGVYQYQANSGQRKTVPIVQIVNK